jgi:DNA-binding GntR family transcriptional regulator
MAAEAAERRTGWYKSAVRTLPEQIADDLGASIAGGEIPAGERLLEETIAQRYGVSRGPVREALRILVQRGLAVLYPRRGAFVVEVGLDALVDLFNTRAVLMGLAARYFAVMGSSDAKAQLAEDINQLAVVANDQTSDGPSFIRVTSRISVLISRMCGSESLGRLIEHQNDSSVWGSLWQSGHVDFGTRERRLRAAADYSALGAAVERSDGADAEAVMRHLIMISRENVVASLASIRGESYDSRRLLSA